ncbi:MAG: PTS lactose/cellobiose transporter subunit IIA [Longibaculum sp.]
MEKKMYTKEEIAQIAFSLIVHAGDAKSQAQQAISASNIYDFKKADSFIEQANVEIKEAHEIQTKIVQAEAGGTDYEVTVLLVHAQDHFAMAMTAIDVAKQMIQMNKRIQDLEKKIGGDV